MSSQNLQKSKPERMVASIDNFFMSQEQIKQFAFDVFDAVLRDIRAFEEQEKEENDGKEVNAA